MSYLWNIERNLPNNLWVMTLWKFEILQGMYGWHYSHPKMYQFLMANKSVISKAKRLKIGYLTKLNTFFYHFKSIYEYHDAYYQQTRMLMEQNINNEVGKDSRSINWPNEWQIGQVSLGCESDSCVPLQLLAKWFHYFNAQSYFQQLKAYLSHAGLEAKAKKPSFYLKFRSLGFYDTSSALFCCILILRSLHCFLCWCVSLLFLFHFQLPPVIKNMAFQKFSNMEQSLFTRFVRLGVPTVQLDAQGRARSRYMFDAK